MKVRNWSLPVDEILGLNKSGADLQTDIEPEGESTSTVERNETSEALQSLPSILAPVVYKTYQKREIFNYIVSIEVDGTDSAANPSLDTLLYSNRLPMRMHP